MTAAVPAPQDPDTSHLERTIAELKRRESLYIRAISEMLVAPKLVAADVVDGHWEAVFDNGEKWRCVPMVRRNQHEPSHEWVLTKACPAGRAGIRALLGDDLASVPPLTLMPRGAA